jgi:hypothetical protein
MIKEELQMLDYQERSSKTPPGQCWRPPDPRWIKIDTDGTIDIQEMKGGGGGAARSHLSFISALSKPQMGVTDPLIAEVLAF